MPIIDQHTHAAPHIHSMDLAVEQSGMTITVRSGAVKIEGTDRSLTEDEVFTSTTQPEAVDVIAYLVVDTLDGDRLRVFVDEIVLDGSDDLYVFERGGQYTLLAYLYRLHIPASSTSLDAVDVVRYRMVPPPVEEEPS